LGLLVKLNERRALSVHIDTAHWRSDDRFLCQNCVRYAMKPGSNIVTYGDAAGALPSADAMTFVFSDLKRTEDRA